ncbi:DsbA family protein [Pseudokineococcus sp. 1T1Z-3]|uniref:DsbA family protein n=1 Tax=Pseudokineococcus sp. 1T1Z-3 TaxID=3132745 RepID=UPI0030A0B485
MPTSATTERAARARTAGRHRRRRTSTRLTAVVAVLAAAAAALVVLGLAARDPAGAGDVPVVRADSHHLADGGEGAPVLVEFLDLECEACAAAHPLVHELREEHEGRLSVVARHFPMPGHLNAETAAVAAEAAAQQGAFAPMVDRMYETQPQWGEQQESKAALFRGFAADLRLDLEAYDAAVADPATLARVARDLRDGQALGVQGTPTFFLDGEPIAPRSVAELRQLVADAVAEAP